MTVLAVFTALAMSLPAGPATAAPTTTSAVAPAPAANIVVTYVGFTPRAKRAFEFAVRRWESLISTPVTIRVRARWADLGPGPLGNAHTRWQTGQVAGLRGDRYYPMPLLSSIAGRDVEPGAPDIFGTFNRARSNWYLGTDGNTPANKIDFVSLVMHELGHGLGVGGFLTVNGSGAGTWGARAGIYDTFIENRAGRRLLTFRNRSGAPARQLTSNAVFWGGRKGVAYNGGDRPRLFAPRPFWSGSSIGHLDEATYPPGTRNALMTPFGVAGETALLPGPIILGVLRDIGWQLGPRGRTIVSRLTLVSASVSDGSVAAGTAVRVRGSLRKAETARPVPNQTVTLYQRRIGGAWRTVGSAATSSTGAVRFTVRPTQNMQYQLRHPRTATTDGDISPIRTVSVT